MNVSQDAASVPWCMFFSLGRDAANIFFLDAASHATAAALALPSRTPVRVSVVRGCCMLLELIPGKIRG